MNSEFCADLQRQIFEAITNGKKKFVFWGVNNDSAELLSSLSKYGILESYISGIVDADTRKQGQKIFQFEVLPPERLKELEIDVLVVTVNAEKEEALRKFAEIDNRIPDVIISGIAHFDFRDKDFDKILASCLVKSYANGYEPSLIHIYQSIRYLSKNNIRGDVAEFGIFKGGTIVFIAKTLEYFGYQDCKIYGFDIFEGFPKSKTLFDLYRNPQCEFNDYAAVQDYCQRYRIEVVKGDICETYKILDHVPLMLSFFDTDNYSPSRAALETCYRQTVRGGVLHFDHYISQPQFIYTIGERMAAEEVLCDKNVFHLQGTGTFMKCS